MWRSKDRDKSNFIQSSFYSFSFVTLLLSMLTPTYFLVITRRWHLSPFGFIWFSLNHVNRLSVQFFSLLKTVYKFESYVWGVPYQRSWWDHIRVFQKTNRRCLYWKEADLILTLAEHHMLYERRGCRNYVFLFFSFSH